MGRIQQVTSLVLWFITFQIALSLPARDDFVGTSTSSNISLDPQSIGIPAESSLSKRYLTLADAVAKGSRLLCRLENPDLLNDQSPVTSIDMLPANGWVSNVELVDSEMDDVLDQIFYQEGFQNNPDDMVTICWRHEETSRNSNGERVPGTMGRYTNVYNAKAGYIIAYNNFGPAYMVRAKTIKTLPDIRAWSDITFIEWQLQARMESRDVSGLKYVIRYDIVNDDTVDIIAQAAGPAFLIAWPGVTLSMSTEQGRAILGTPNGVGVAYLLATHKVQLGHKTVESVQVWTQRIVRATGLTRQFYAVFKIVPGTSSSGPSTSM